MRVVINLFLLSSIFLLYANELKPITLQLQWKYQFQFAGFIVAKERGYYKEAGLDVKLLEFDGKDGAQKLLNHEVDYLLVNTPLLIKDKKLLDATLLATYFHQSPLVFVTQPEIRSISDFVGKTILINNNTLRNSPLAYLLDLYNINETNAKFLKDQFENKIELFTKKKVDVITAFTTNEVIVLEKKGVHFHTINPTEYGIISTANNLFTTKEKAKKDAKEIVKFLEATKRGWEYALAHKKEVVALIHQKYRQDLSQEHLYKEALAVEKLMMPSKYIVGEMHLEYLYALIQKLQKDGLIDTEVDTTSLLFPTKKYLNLQLTIQEQEYIKNHKKLTYSEVNWKPLSIIEDNRMKGIMGDYLDLVSKKSGLEFVYIVSKSWPEVLEKFQKREIDIVPGAGSSPQEKKLGLMSIAYDRFPMVIVTRDEYRFVTGIEDLKDKIFAVPKYYTSYNFLTTNYPDITVVATKNIKEALKLVHEKKADAFIGHIATALYYLNETGYDDLKISGNTKFTFEHHYLIHHDNLILLSIINKAFRAITDEERSLIHSKWLLTKVQKEIDYRLAFIVGVVLGTAFILLYGRHKALQKHQKETQELNDKIELALEASRSGIWEWNVITNEVFFSKGWKKIIGYEDYEISNRFEEWEKRVHPEDLPKVMQNVQKALDGEIDSFEVVHRMKHKDGHWVWINDKAKAYRDEKGNVIKFSGVHTDITAQKIAQDELLKKKLELDHLAYHDTLTNLPNRALFFDRLSQAIKTAHRDNKKVALLFIDLDNFKEINDTFGHDTGDRVLQIIAQRLEQLVRESDTVARLGGDEFTIVLGELKHGEDSVVLADKILEAIQKPIEIEKHHFYLSCSIGIAIYPDDAQRAEELIKFADSAMYKAKKEGKNNFQFYTKELTQKAFEKVVLENALREAIEADAFDIYYQPQVDMRSGKIIGAEALVRWNHDTMGMIAPDRFIPLAEQSGLIMKLDKLIMKKVLHQSKVWQERGVESLKIALNISAKELKNKNFLQDTKEIIDESGCDIAWLEFEITESYFLKDPSLASKILQEISQMGISIAIDDFGIGYSSLSYLKQLPINKLKIDRAFIKELPDDEDDRAIVEAIIALAKSLNLDILAEGVETQAQAEFLMTKGCLKAQGYLYYRPLSIDEFEKLLV